MNLLRLKENKSLAKAKDRKHNEKGRLHRASQESSRMVVFSAAANEWMKRPSNMIGELSHNHEIEFSICLSSERSALTQLELQAQAKAEVNVQYFSHILPLLKC